MLISNKSIIISLIIFLLLSFGFLAYTETKQQSPDSQNWWTVYFEDPKNESLNFIIENNSDQTVFHYETLAQKSTTSSTDIEIKKGEKKNIEIIKPDIESSGNMKFSIIVSTGNDKKEIYKNFEN